MQASIAVQGCQLVLITLAAFLGIEAVAWAFVAGKGFEVLVYQSLIRRQLPVVTVGRLVRTHGRSLLVSAIALSVPMVVYLMQDPSWSWWWPLAVSVPGTVVAWVAAIFLCRHPLASELQMVADRVRQRVRSGA